MTYVRLVIILCSAFLLSHCAQSGGSLAAVIPNMKGPTVAERNAKISAEPSGNYYLGRRYYVEKTRFWGYLRKPGQSWSRAKLVLMNERQKRAPDRLPEKGPSGRRYGYDSNYEYKIYGRYTGQKAYDPNSNQVLPEFLLTGYELKEKDPGWLFSPRDRYDPKRVTLRP